MTASEFVRTIRSPQRTSSLAAAIAEVGRIAKTLFLLSHVDDEAYRRRIREGQEDQLGALGLVVNVVCLWNSLYLDQSVRRLREEGAEARDEDLARVSPLSRAHVNVLGRYSFDLDESLAGGGMRPLRNPSEIEEDEFPPPRLASIVSDGQSCSDATQTPVYEPLVFAVPPAAPKRRGRRPKWLLKAAHAV